MSLRKGEVMEITEQIKQLKTREECRDFSSTTYVPAEVQEIADYIGDSFYLRLKLPLD